MTKNLIDNNNRKNTDVHIQAKNDTKQQNYHTCKYVTLN